MSVGFLILAAGKSSRFGKNKLMAPMVNGRSIFETVFENIKQAADSMDTNNIAVVIRPEHQGIARYLNQKGYKNQALICDSQGLGESIAFGVKHNADWSGWIICLADMPFISPDIFCQIYLQGKQNPTKIIRPVFDGREGHPVFFGRNSFEKLISLKGDKGGQRIILDEAENLVLLPCKHNEVYLDIDTREQYETLKEKYKGTPL